MYLFRNQQLSVGIDKCSEFALWDANMGGERVLSLPILRGAKLNWIVRVPEKFSMILFPCYMKK